MKPLRLVVVCLAAAAAVLAQYEPDREDLQRPQDRRFHLAADKKNAATARFIGLLKTSTHINVVTSTHTFYTKSLCASLVNVTGACARRRRGVMDKPVVLSFDDEEHIDIFNPSPVQSIEPTTGPEVATRSDRPLEIEGSRDGQTIEVDIIGLDDNCVVQARTGFGKFISLFLKSTTTLTATLVTTTTITNGFNTFIVSLCTPNPFVYRVC